MNAKTVKIMFSPPPYYSQYEFDRAMDEWKWWTNWEKNNRSKMMLGVHQAIREFRAENQAEHDKCRKRYLDEQKQKHLAEIIENCELAEKYDEEWFKMSCMERVTNLRRKIKKIDGEIEYVFKKKKTKNDITESDIQRARETDIIGLDLINATKKSGTNTHVTPCLYHNEKTGSMTIYSGDRGFYCYGCGKHGTAIDIVMKVLNLNFVDAVKYLLGK